MKRNKNIILQGITFSFAQQQKIFFNDLNIEFISQNINFIQGKNGVGKSTLLQILSGKMSKDNQLQGELQIDDIIYDVADVQQIAKVVAFVPQNFDEILVDAYSFSKNLQCAQISHYPSLFQLSQKKPLPLLIKKYGINYNIPVSLLSGGQRQILSILMVLEQAPEILLLDEPTAALDEENTIIVMDFLQDLCADQGLTIIAIIHNQELVEKYAPQGYFELTNHFGQREVRFIAL